MFAFFMIVCLIELLVLFQIARYMRNLEDLKEIGECLDDLTILISNKLKDDGYSN